MVTFESPYLDPRIEARLHREYGAQPSHRNLIAVDRLAQIPAHLVDLVIDSGSLESIHIGRGGVCDLDEMEFLRGQYVSDTRWTPWEQVAARYFKGRLIIGDLKAESVDVCSHEFAHAIDVAEQMVSHSREFRALHAQCLKVGLDPRFHKPEELFAEIFAAVFVITEDRVAQLTYDEALAAQLIEWVSYRYGL